MKQSKEVIKLLDEESIRKVLKIKQEEMKEAFCKEYWGKIAYLDGFIAALKYVLQESEDDKNE